MSLQLRADSRKQAIRKEEQEIGQGDVLNQGELSYANGAAT
jgi:hypothetical protein